LSLSDIGEQEAKGEGRADGDIDTYGIWGNHSHIKTKHVVTEAAK